MNKKILTAALVGALGACVLISVVGIVVVKIWGPDRNRVMSQPQQTPVIQNVSQEGPTLRNVPQQTTGMQSMPSRNVVINGVRLSDQELGKLEQGGQGRIPDGSYWYDRMTGAWGVQGSPAQLVITPGLNLGGPLRRDASGGNSGVFINGRELQVSEVQYLQQFTVVQPGRYWLDAQGNGGYEGQPASFNLYQLAQAARSTGGGGTGGNWGYRSPYSDASVGGDGQGFSYYIDRDSSYSSGP